VLSARSSVVANAFALKQASISRGPMIDIGGQYTQGYTDRVARDPSWDLLLSLSWPLFDGHATRADEIAARARLRRAQAELQRALNQAALDVESALVEVERTSRRAEASEKSVAAAQARLAAATGKYQQGVGILIEVIDARVAVTNARANLVRARYDHQIALVGLQRALGTLAIPGAEMASSGHSSRD
jgi:outer membrane protein TolC